MKTCYLIVLCYFLAGLSSHSQAQTSLPTERVVSMRVENQTPQQFLQNLSQQAQTQFSYNPQIFAGVAPLNLRLQGVTVREALFQAFGNAIKLKTKGNYIILQKTNLPIQSQQASARPLKILLSGYVIDQQTQQKIPNVSVYEKRSLSATLTNAQGFFQLLIETEEPNLTLSFAKTRYAPQGIEIPAQNIPFLNVQLKLLPEIKPLPTRDSLIFPPRQDNPHFFDVLIPQTQTIHRQNLGGFEQFLRKTQVSLLPMVGTNHVLSGLVNNTFSFNIIGGYNAGIDGVEIGGAFNINKGDVGKLQIAGIFNAVSGKVKGVQIGGLLNVVRDSVSGVQIGGWGNTTLQKMKGVQLGGVLNLGLGGVEGLQLAGTINFTRKSMKGAQVAGFVNIALGEMEGIQLSGLINVAGKTKNGWQVGVFNYADSSQHLKQIGLVNFVRVGGYKNIELSTNEMLFTDLTIRSGTPYFYTLARIGIKSYPVRPFWHYGYGLGCRLKAWRTWESNTELVAYHLLHTMGKDKIKAFENFGARYQLYITKHVGKHFSIALAGAVDFCSLHMKGIDYADALTLSPTPFLDLESQNRLWRVSGGGTFGLRFRW